MRPLNLTAWLLRLVAIVIMLQTLYFKFSGAEKSVYIFTTLGIKPWGRFGTGVMELLASLLIVLPKTTSLGALLALGIMSGAVAGPLFVLGLVVKNDGGQLFIYALPVLISTLVLLIIYRKQLLLFIPPTLLPNRFKMHLSK